MPGNSGSPAGSLFAMDLDIECCVRYRARVMASFIVDDVYAATDAEAAAYLRFSEWVESAGLRGQASAMLGFARDASGRAVPTHPAFAKELARASSAHLEAHMEIFTHGRLYDFAADCMRTDGPHEGIWLRDRDRAEAEYRAYFEGIAVRAHALGIRHAGLTLPGCGCAECIAFKKERGVSSRAEDLNPGVARALLGLAKEGRLLSPAVTLFIGKAEGPADAFCQREDGRFAVYDVPPCVNGDRFGRWENDPQFIDLDAYLSPDGRRGELVDALARGSHTLVWYGHWQSIRPDTGVGFAPFGELAERVRKHFGEKIVWMRPSQIAAYRHTQRHLSLTKVGAGEGNRLAFELALPFEPLHEVTLRVTGSAKAKLRAPQGEVLSPSETRPGEAKSYFTLWPKNGRYEVLPA